MVRQLYSCRRAGGWLCLAMAVALGVSIGWPSAIRAQEEPPADESAPPAEKPKAEEGEAAAAPEEEKQDAEPADEKSVKSYPMHDGTRGYGHTEEIEKKKTADGEIETQRVRAPGYGGDARVLYERETRTRKLADGSIEREYVLRNPDGSGRMRPIEITREKVRASGDVTTTEREMMRPDSSGKWTPLRRERITQTGEEKSRQSVKEVRERTLAGDWKVVDRTVTAENTTEAGKSSRSVRQTPNAYGELADFEVREESSRRDGDKATTEVNLRRRDTQDTHNPKFFLAERTRTEETKAADGKVVRKSVTESDLVADGASRNVTPGAPKTVEEKTEEETTAPDGSTRRVVTMRSRGAVNRELQSTGRIVQETDSRGNVRQILIPAQ